MLFPLRYLLIKKQDILLASISSFQQDETSDIIATLGGGYCTQVELATKRLHDEFIKKHGRKPTLEEFMKFEEPYCTQIEPQTIWTGEGDGQIVSTLLKKYPCLGIITDMADEYFVGFRQYIQDEMIVILELKMLIEADLKK